MDFENELLTADQTGLLPELVLDGTHMHPTYLHKVERCIDSIVSTSGGASSASKTSSGKKMEAK